MSDHFQTVKGKS